MLRIVKDVPGQALWLAEDTRRCGPPVRSPVILWVVLAVAWLAPAPYVLALFCASWGGLGGIEGCMGAFTFLW